jgi:dihydroorotate dehydrogenase electron transfer subunit
VFKIIFVAKSGQMAKSIENFKITGKKQLNSDFFILDLLSEKNLTKMQPGQFVQVKVDDSPETFLRRPFSIHDVDYETNTLRILIQIAGPGTKALSKLVKGDIVNIIYPLGNSFSLPVQKGKSLLIGGGCGIAPLLFLGNFLKSNGYTTDVLLGFRNRERILEYENYLKIGRVFITTEDGSEGEKGFVTSHPILQSEHYDNIYCCGPEVMMKAVSSYCKKQNITCEVSLENLMGCGIGACLCCVVDTKKGNLCTCIDGPVFNINELKW